MKGLHRLAHSLLVLAVAMTACNTGPAQQTPTITLPPDTPAPTETPLAPESTPTETAAPTSVAPTPTEPAMSPGTRWVLQSYGRPDDAQDILDGTRLTIEFDSQGRVSGSAGCNTYFGEYELNGAQMRITSLGWTEMACPQPVMEQEEEYLAALQAVHSYQVQADALRLGYDEQMLTFTRLEPRAALDNTAWLLESFTEQANLRTVLEGTQVSAVFDSVTHQVSGSAGCNRYFARYQVLDSELTIASAASTKMMCLEPSGVMEQEQSYLAALESAQSYLILGGKLVIVSSGDRLLRFVPMPPETPTSSPGP